MLVLDGVEVAPIEGDAIAAWEWPVFRRLGIEQDQRDVRLVGAASLCIVSARHADRLDEGKPVALGNRLDAFWRFLAVQLDEIGLYTTDDRVQKTIIRVDDQGDAERTTASGIRQRRCVRRRQVTRTRREEDETDVVRTRIQSRIEHLGRADTADLDFGRLKRSGHDAMPIIGH